MKKTGLLNPDLNYAIARLGHTDTWAVADCGLPIPEHVDVIDLSLVFGVPSFSQTLAAVLGEVVVEGAVIARDTSQEVRDLISAPQEEVTHEELKRMITDCAFVIRTGETTPFANVIFRAGDAF